VHRLIQLLEYAVYHAAQILKFSVTQQPTLWMWQYVVILCF